jgi:uncharacterized protein
MAESPVAGTPVWVDLSSADPAGSRAFYSGLFGWDVQVSSDPQYGGYAMAQIDGQDVAGIGPTMAPEAPTAWMIYLATADADAVARDVSEAGGRVVAPPFEVGGQGRMAVFQDPAGAFISVWQPLAMSGFVTGLPNGFGWAELNARGIDADIPFYERVFGWSHRSQPMGEGMPPYIEFQLGGTSVAGGMEMNPMVPAGVPSYWMVYFRVADVDAMFQAALAAGAREMLAPQDFPGGRLAILSDPQGAVFGVMKMAAR